MVGFKLVPTVRTLRRRVVAQGHFVTCSVSQSFLALQALLRGYSEQVVMRSIIRRVQRLLIHVLPFQTEYTLG